MGCDIVKVYKDHGISGAKGCDGRPQFDAMCRDAAKRQFDVVMAWSVDRLGRSLQDLVALRAVIGAVPDPDQVSWFQVGSGAVIELLRSFNHSEPLKRVILGTRHIAPRTYRASVSASGHLSANQSA